MAALILFVRRRWGVVTLVAWFAGMLAVGAGLLARHLVALPAPAIGAGLAASISTLRGPHSRTGWLAVHVLYAECPCSQRIVEHLIATERSRDWSEIVLWVGSPDPKPALERRFDVRRIGSADLARFGIESAPMLVLVDPEGAIRYAGGYTDRKQGPVIDDLRIFEEARRLDVVASLPVFGCAVSGRLKRALLALPIP